MKKTSNPSWMKKGWLQMQVYLPPDLAKLFLAEMVVQDRKKMPLAVQIIRTYFKERAAREEFEQFKLFQAGARRYRFGGGDAPRGAASPGEAAPAADHARPPKQGSR